MDTGVHPRTPKAGTNLNHSQLLPVQFKQEFMFPKTNYKDIQTNKNPSLSIHLRRQFIPPPELLHTAREHINLSLMKGEIQTNIINPIIM